jgi:hypothetical protein
MGAGRSVSLSGDEKGIDGIWSWYDDQLQAIRAFRNDVLSLSTTGALSTNSKFLGYTQDELIEYFSDSVVALEDLVSFDLISATEGVLKNDYFTRVYKKDKSELGRKYREIHKLSLDKPRLELDIIDTCKDCIAYHKRAFSDYQGILHFRHWLAHGRFWTLSKKGRRYDPNQAYEIAESVVKALTEYSAAS